MLADDNNDVTNACWQRSYLGYFGFISVQREEVVTRSMSSLMPVVKMIKQKLWSHTHVQSLLTCGVAGLCTERQDFDIFIIGACSQQLPTMAPGYTVDGTFVMLVPLEADDRLLDWT